MRSREEITTKLEELEARITGTLDPAVDSAESTDELERVAHERVVLRWVMGEAWPVIIRPG